LGAATPPAFFTAARITSATSSSAAPSAGADAVLFLVNCALSPKAAGTQVAEGLGAAGTDEAAITARLMLQTAAPCFPPQARPDFCRMAHKCTPKGQSSAGFGHSSVWNSGHIARPFFKVAVNTLPLSWSGTSGEAAVSASCLAFSAASMNRWALRAIFGQRPVHHRSNLFFWRGGWGSSTSGSASGSVVVPSNVCTKPGASSQQTVFRVRTGLVMRK